MSTSKRGFDRRKFTTYFAGFGLAGTTLPKLLWAEVEEKGGVSKQALIGAEKIAGLEFTDAERELMLSGVEDLRKALGTLVARSSEAVSTVSPLPACDCGSCPFRARYDWAEEVGARCSGGRRLVRYRRIGCFDAAHVRVRDTPTSA